MLAYAAIQLGNFFYFLPIVLLIALTVVLVRVCDKKGAPFTNKLILIILWCNFGLHFVKQFLPGYIDNMPGSLYNSSLPNFCALLIVVAPFIYLWGNVYFKDYFYFMGIISATMVYLFPTSVLGVDLSVNKNLLEMLRFYLCHAPLLIVPILMVKYRFHTLDYRRLVIFPLTFLLFNGVVFLNGCFFAAIRFPTLPNTFEAVLDRDGNIFNQSFSVGPKSSLDPLLSPIYKILIPYLQVYYVDGQIHFTPVIWMGIPIALVTPIIGGALAWPFESRHLKMDFEAFKIRRAIKKINR